MAGFEGQVDNRLICAHACSDASSFTPTMPHLKPITVYNSAEYSEVYEASVSHFSIHPYSLRPGRAEVVMEVCVLRALYFIFQSIC